LAHHKYEGEHEGVNDCINAFWFGSLDRGIGPNRLSSVMAMRELPM